MQQINRICHEFQQAHQALDQIRVPRVCGERVLSLSARIYWLNGQLSAARFGAGLVREAKKAKVSS